ncbi:MAG TPA: DUF3418 domain-containing protein, partial [Steroidobacteraceae bacterium]|nr:DUF3418 domain-containing protein [Steroidobacteraceae bacterium]
SRVRPFVSALGSLQSSPDGLRAEVAQLRWMIEEYRVSLFAQDLRTTLRVSAQRLTEQLERAKDEARS